MQLTLLSWLFIVAAGQGLFLSLFLVTARQAEVRQANRLLAALVLVFVLIIAHALMGMHGMFVAYPQAARAVATLPLLIGPLLLLYLRGLLHGERLSRRSLRHFAPFVLALLAWMPYYLQSAEARLPVLQPHGRFPAYITVFALFKVLHLFAYMVASHRLIVRTEREQPGQALVRGLRRLTLWLAAGLAIDAVLFAAELLDPSLPDMSDSWGGLVLIGFVYGLALLSMRLPLGYRPQPLSVTEPAKPRYAASQLTPADSTAFLRALTASMEQDHAYRDGELTLDGLAERLAMSAHELSQLINQSCGVNFQEYVNGHRVTALKLAMADAGQAGASILDLGVAAGFNSKSTMNRAFKKQTGMTPTEFRAARG